MSALIDNRARKRIKVLIDRLMIGMEGDWKPVGAGVREMRIPEGKGYRVYYGWDGEAAVILLCGGDKDSQRRDIRWPRPASRPGRRSTAAPWRCPARRAAIRGTVY